MLLEEGGGGANRRQQYILPQKRVSIVLKQLHDASTAGHLGVQKTLGKLQQRFYWVGQRKDVEEWCHHCDICASRKFPLKHPKAPLVPSFISNPLDRIAIDILRSLPTTPRGNIISDYFTKWTEAFPLKDMEASTVARVLFDEFICRFGAPAYLHTDQGRN